jgi:hypothetical protein
MLWRTALNKDAFLTYIFQPFVVKAACIEIFIKEKQEALLIRKCTKVMWSSF